MGLSVMDQETDELARQVARLTGETPSEAVRVALVERLARERSKLGNRSSLSSELEAIVLEFAALPLLDTRSPDDIIGWDDRGLPN